MAWGSDIFCHQWIFDYSKCSAALCLGLPEASGVEDISRLFVLVFCFLHFFGNLAFATLDVKSLVAHLLFLQHFFPDAYLKYDALRVTWTLTVEAVWYVLAFLIAAKFFKAPSKYTIVFVLLACVWVGRLFHVSVADNPFIPDGDEAVEPSLLALLRPTADEVLAEQRSQE